MISDSVVGLIELVKNAYDADAGRVMVTLEGLETPENIRITIEDDGFGMSPRDVQERFLSPAIDHKARAKERQERTPKYRRLPIGEKGVGRFAIQQLGRYFHLITRAEGHPEVVTQISWEDFDKPDALLTDITFDIVQRDPEVFGDGRTGTRLILTHARDVWDAAKVAKLQRGLRRLRSPHVEEGKQDFDVMLSCEDYPDLQSLDQGDLRERYHYRFSAIIEADGAMHYEYVVRHPGVPPRMFSSEASGRNLAADARSELATGANPTCGPFYLNLYVWDRTANHLAASGIGRRELDAVAGVSLFRDRLRVLPYGEYGDDWLYLDRDRINSPSERIGNNQVVGYVEITQDKDSELRDKTNREGLIDNAAFRDLRAMVRAGVRFFETLWRDDRPVSAPVTTRPEPPPASQNLRRARTIASALGASSRSDVPVTVPYLGEVSVGVLSTDAEQPTLDAPSPIIITQRQAADRVVNEIDGALSVQKDIEKRRREERELLLHLAATGQSAERITHEFGRQVVAALQALDHLREGGPRTAGSFKVLENALGTLRNEFRILSPDGGVTRFQKRRTVSVKEIVEVAVGINQHLLDQRQLTVEVNGSDFHVFARSSSIVQIIDNLIHNALHWARPVLNGVAPIHVMLDRSRRTVVIRDNGPGVSLERPDAIFEPTVTTRPGGHGLGLYIVRELLAAEGGKISLVSVVPGEGAIFEVDFSGYPSTGREEHE